MQLRWLVLGPLIAACADAPGACIEEQSTNGVREGFCLEVDNSGQCPVAESRPSYDGWRLGSENKSSALTWEFHEGTACEDLNYPFNCWGDLWEDSDIQCAATPTTGS